MFAYTHGNLVRQMKGLEVLHQLLEEEFAQLCDRLPDEVTATEFSIHELMRQLAVERLELKNSLQGQRIAEVMLVWEEQQQTALNEVLAQIDEFEQLCARQASRNAELALALHDQSQALLDHIHDQIKPKKQTYGKMGRYAQPRPEATLIRGRL